MVSFHIYTISWQISFGLMLQSFSRKDIGETFFTLVCIPLLERNEVDSKQAVVLPAFHRSLNQSPNKTLEMGTKVVVRAAMNGCAASRSQNHREVFHGSF